MNLPMQSLDEAELDELDRFLLYRGRADTDVSYVEGRDEGILTLSELDGFLTAVVSGPTEIVPGHWLPVVWGDVEPEWVSVHTFEHIFSLLLRHMHGIAAALLDSDKVFQPLFMEQEANGQHYTIVHEWCRGYMRGMGLAQELWERGGDEMLGLLMPIDLFTNGWGRKIVDSLNAQENALLKQQIGPAARAICSYWLVRRGGSALRLSCLPPSTRC